MLEVQSEVLSVISCKMCKKEYDIQLPLAGYFAWTFGAAVQDAFPDMPKEQRELLISQTCESCFKKLGGCDDCSGMCT